mgnify:CR=1 FL=1
MCFRLLKEAKNRGIKISFDFNYRSKLWTIDEAKPVYKKFMQYFDVVFGSFFDANTILDIPLDEGMENATLSEKRRNVFPKMIRKYKLSYIFGTDRVVYSATENSLAGYYFRLNGTELSWELTEPIRFNIYDRIGGGGFPSAAAVQLYPELVYSYKQFTTPDYDNFGYPCCMLKTIGTAGMGYQKWADGDFDGVGKMTIGENDQINQHLTDGYFMEV